MTASKWIHQALKPLAHRPLAMEIRQHIIELLESAIASCRGEGCDQAETVHDLRVLMKRLRAFWQLMAAFVSKSELQQAKDRLASAAKQLSAHRDRQVLGDALAQLVQRLPEPSQQALLSLEIPLPDEDVRQDEIDWSQILQVLQNELSVWRGLAVDASLKHVERGVMATFERERKLAERATRKKAEIRQRHQWRKWVKYLYYQLKLLQQLGLKGHKTTVKRLDELGDLLGREHDFEMLLTFLQEQTNRLPMDERTPYQHLIELNRIQLQQLRKQSNRLEKTVVKSY
ncbi:MAG: CHAD domain-containing protein [Hydrogenovibrio sp.]|nr:CHAD domain-containing protein [Hydrogenovibrio sp.]